MVNAPSQRGFLEHEEARRQAGRLGAALVLLYPKGGRAHTVLTLRSDQLRDHAGQISFPGGRRESGESLEQAALREAQEELAIPPEGLEVLSALTPIYIPPSDFLLYPKLAVARRRPDFRAQPSEVAEIIEVPMEHFLAHGNRRVETWELRGERRRIPHYRVGEHKVWGATAMVLAELVRLWSESRSLSANPRLDVAEAGGP